METLTLQANSENAARLDAFLAAQAENLTRSAAARLIEEGRVLVDGNGRTRGVLVENGS